MKPQIYFPNLNGLRSVAFLMVFIQHAFSDGFYLLDIKDSIIEKVFWLIGSGGNGVSIFFVLSGFLITYLLLVEKNTNGNIKILNFYIRRTLRIWPLYFAYVFFIFIIYPSLKSSIGINSLTASKPIYYFTFLSNFDIINVKKFFPGLDPAIESITWSIAVEEQFYLIWPLIFIFIPKSYYKLTFLFIISGSIFFRYLHADDYQTIYFHSLSVCGDLALGGLCAYYSLFSNSFKTNIRHLSKFFILSIYIVGCIWLLFSSSIISGLANILFTRIINILFFAFIILEQNFSSNSFYKFSNFRLLSFWGKYTYGLYLLHPLVLLFLDVVFRILNLTYKNSFLKSTLIGFGGLIISLILSYLSFEYYEKWFLKVKEKYSSISNQNEKLVVRKNFTPS